MMALMPLRLGAAKDGVTGSRSMLLTRPLPMWLELVRTPSRGGHSPSMTRTHASIDCEMERRL